MTRNDNHALRDYYKLTRAELVTIRLVLLGALLGIPLSDIEHAPDQPVDRKLVAAIESDIFKLL